MIDPAALWDLDDPAASEARFRAAARTARTGDQTGDGAELLTQVARALGLQGRYDEGHALLDGLMPGGEPCRARDWEASLLDNIGMVHAAAEDRTGAAKPSRCP